VIRLYDIQGGIHMDVLSASHLKKTGCSMKLNIDPFIKLMYIYIFLENLFFFF